MGKQKALVASDLNSKLKMFYTELEKFLSKYVDSAFPSNVICILLYSHLISEFSSLKSNCPDEILLPSINNESWTSNSKVLALYKKIYPSLQSSLHSVRKVIYKIRF